MSINKEFVEIDIKGHESDEYVLGDLVEWMFTMQNRYSPTAKVILHNIRFNIEIIE